MVFAARLTQRGHTIHSMDDLMALYEKAYTADTVKRIASLPHPAVQKFSVITVAVVGASRHQNEVKFISASLLLPRTFFYSGGIFPVPAATPAASSGTAVIAAKSFLRTLSFPCASQGSAAGTADVPMQSFLLPSSLTHRSPSPSMFLLPGAVKTGDHSVLYSADSPTLTKTISHPWPVLTAGTGGNGSGLFLPALLPSGNW